MVTRKQSTSIFPNNEHFLPPDLSGGTFRDSPFCLIARNFIWFRVGSLFFQKYLPQKEKNKKRCLLLNMRFFRSCAFYKSYYAENNSFKHSINVFPWWFPLCFMWFLIFFGSFLREMLFLRSMSCCKVSLLLWDCSCTIYNTELKLKYRMHTSIRGISRTLWNMHGRMFCKDG